MLNDWPAQENKKYYNFYYLKNSHHIQLLSYDTENDRA